MASPLIRNSLLGFVIGGAALVLLLEASSPRPAQKNPTYPRQILIIRHAEKPPDAAMSTDLSAPGKDRATALHKLFEKSDTRPTPFPKPDFIFAAKDSGKSKRPVQTVTPLASKLDLPVDARFTNDDPVKLAEELFGNAKYEGKTILISWRHGTTPELAAVLNATSFPKTWKDDVFDRVWQITYGEKGKATFADVPQRLMPADSEN